MQSFNYLKYFILIIFAVLHVDIVASVFFYFSNRGVKKVPIRNRRLHSLNTDGEQARLSGWLRDGRSHKYRDFKNENNGFFARRGVLLF